MASGKKTFLAVALIDLLVGARLVCRLVAAAPAAPVAEMPPSLWDAVVTGDVAAVKTTLRQRPELVNSRTEWGGTPLFLAVGWGNAGMVEAVLEAGTDPNAGTDYGDTPLRVAARLGDVHVAKLLLDKGASPTAASRDGELPANDAFVCGHADLARLILTKGGKTDIFCATALGDVEEVRGILTRAPESAKSTYPLGEEGETPLAWAARWGRLEIAKLLVAAGADADADGGGCGWRPIEWAALEGHEDLVEFLLASGADVTGNPEDFGGALHLASLS